MPKMWQIINLVIFSLIILFIFIVSFFVEGFNEFIGFSISIVFGGVCALGYALNEIVSDISNFSKKPVFFSPWIFPVYRYNAKKNDVDKRNKPSIILVSSLLIILGWSILCSVWIDPFFIGISFSILVELILLVISLHLISITSVQMKDVIEYVDDRLVRNAWLDTKQGYVVGRGADSRENLATYEKVRYRRDNFRNYIRQNEGRPLIPVKGISG